MLPPIRYPLPTLVALTLVSLLIWRGEAWTRPLRSSIADRLAKAVEGPPIPHSDRPQGGCNAAPAEIHRSFQETEENGAQQ